MSATLARPRRLIPFAIVLLSAVAARAASVDLNLTIRGPSGQPLPSAYVAVTALDRQLWRPSAEAIAIGGIATLHVEPGEYQVFVGALGYDDEARSVKLTASRDFTLNLSPAVYVSGKVEDGEGRPIAGARVSQVRLAGPERLAHYSEAARRYFSADWATRTIEDGSWRMPLRRNVVIPLAVEADGFAPVVIDNLTTEHGEVRTVLKEGSRLHVECDRTDPDVLLWLARDSAPEPSVIAEGWQKRLWSKAARAQTLDWNSLPPGSYSIFSAYGDPRRFSHPIRIAAFTVASGQRANVHVTLPRAQAPAQNTLTLFIRQAKASDRELGDEFIRAFTSTKAGPDEIEHSFEVCASGILLYLKTAASPQDVFALTPNEVIAPKATTELAASGDAVETVTAPRADITFRVSAAGAAAALPRWARATYGACDFGGSINLSAFVSAEGAITLPFPTSCRSVVVDLAPFGPVVIDASLQPLEKRDLGSYPLEPAGAARIRVISEPGHAVSRHAIVRALLGSTAGRDPVIISRGITDDEGRLVLPGLPANRDILIEARDRESDLAAWAPLRIEPGKTAVIDPLLIPEPAQLAIAPRLEARFRDRFPDAVIRQITIDRDDRAGKTRQTAIPDEHGQTRFDHLRPGTWRPFVLVEAVGTIQPLQIEDVELRPGERRELEPEIKPSVFDGLVLSEGKGVAAMVSFGQPPSPSALTFYARSNSDGRFMVMLPRTGDYDVSVTPIDHPRDRLDAGEISFADPAVPVMIQPPNNVLLVRVAENTAPVPDVEVIATLMRSRAGGGTLAIEKRGRTDRNGEMHLRGLLDGTWSVGARSLSMPARTALAAVAVVSGRESAVSLDLRPVGHLDGFVHDSSDAAIQDAAVDCMFPGPGELPHWLHTQSAADGRFTLDLPTASPATLYCGITTPSGHIAAFTTSATEGADFHLPAESAPLTIADFGTRLLPDAFWLVADDGRMFDLSWAAGKLRKSWSSEALTLPHVPAGSWKIVRADSTDRLARLASAGGNALDPIANVEIKSGHQETIRIFEKQ